MEMSSNNVIYTCYRRQSRASAISGRDYVDRIRCLLQQQHKLLLQQQLLQQQQGVTEALMKGNDACIKHDTIDSLSLILFYIRIYLTYTTMEELLTVEETSLLHPLQTSHASSFSPPSVHLHTSSHIYLSIYIHVGNSLSYPFKYIYIYVYDVFAHA